MKNVRQLLKPFFFFYVAFLIFSCKSLPPQIEKKDGGQREEVVSVDKHKKMNKMEFGLLLQSFLKEGKYAEAISLFSNERDVESSVLQDEETKMLLLSILISAKKFKEATSLLEELEAKYPNNVSLLYSRVMIAQGENNQKEKDQYLKTILEKFPNDSWALTEQGLDLLYTKKNYALARKKFLLALKHSPNNVESLLGLAKVNYMENKLKEAEQNLNLALKAENGNSGLWIEMARVKSETNRMLQAIEDVKKAIEIDGDVAGYWMDLGLYSMQIGKKKEAKDAFSQAIKLEPALYMAFIYRAGVNDELQFYKEALDDYNKVIELYPDYYFAFEGAGVLYIKNKEWKKAASCFYNALKKAPDHLNYAMLYAFCLYKLDRLKEAKDFIKEYIKTIDRNKKEDEYFLVRLFFENTGDADVCNRVLKVKDKSKYYQMTFYLGAFYEAIKKNTIAEKYYIDVLSAKVPSFIEFRLAKIALNRVRNNEY